MMYKLLKIWSQVGVKWKLRKTSLSLNFQYTAECVQLNIASNSSDSKPTTVSDQWCQPITKNRPEIGVILRRQLKSY